MASSGIRLQTGLPMTNRRNTELITGNKRSNTIGNAYPKSPVIRQIRRVKAKIGGDYSCVDLAMREPVRVINERRGIRTIACCECHPDDIDSRCYEVFRHLGQDGSCTLRQPYRSYIWIDLKSFENVETFMALLRGCGFGDRKDTRPRSSMEYADRDEIIQVYAEYGMELSVGARRLGFEYIYAGGEKMDGGTCSIDIRLQDRQDIRRWEEWDRIRDAGWEHWLEILGLYAGENQ